MPTLWRYLIIQYLKVLTLSVIAFVIVLLTLRLDEIAHFATLGAEGYYIVLYTLFQIPYILPIALPISALISSLILVRSLSKKQELTALRASGFSFRALFAPLLFTAAIVSIANFVVISEFATKSHLTTSLLKNQLRSVNPLLLLHNKHLMNIKGFFFDSLGDSRLGELAGDSILAFPNQHDERLSLLVAGKLQASPEAFGGEDISLITSKEGKEMIIENIHLMDSPIEDFSHLIERKVWTLNNDHLGISLLLAKMDEERYFLNKAIEDNASKEEIKQLTRTQHRGWIEIARRISGALSVFTLTLLGCAFGIHIGRSESSKRIAIVIVLSTLYLISYFVAKGMDHHLEAAIILYTAPHLLIWTASIFAIWRSSRGIEA